MRPLCPHSRYLNSVISSGRKISAGEHRVKSPFDGRHRIFTPTKLKEASASLEQDALRMSLDPIHLDYDSKLVRARAERTFYSPISAMIESSPASQLVSQWREGQNTWQTGLSSESFVSYVRDDEVPGYTPRARYSSNGSCPVTRVTPQISQHAWELVRNRAAAFKYHVRLKAQVDALPRVARPQQHTLSMIWHLPARLGDGKAGQSTGEEGNDMIEVNGGKWLVEACLIHLS